MAIGNFDGVHLAHQKMLDQFFQRADKKKLYKLALVMVPHPAIKLRDIKRYLINTYAQRRQKLLDLGFDQVFEVDFDDHFRSLCAVDFFRDYVESLSVKLMTTGHDLRIGCDQLSVEHTVEKNGSAVEWMVMRPVRSEGGEVISSTKIREALQTGDVKKAQNYLGRPFYIEGEVVEGKKIGKTIGFPTINLEIDPNQIVPKFGVYIVNVVHKFGESFGLVNIGNNPTVSPDRSLKVEAHLLDFDGDLYHSRVLLSFLEFIRPEKKFESLNDLREQISKDILFTRGQIE